MVVLLHGVALVLYAAAAAVLVASLAGGREGAPRAGAYLLIGAVAIHAVALGAFVVRFDELPLVGLAPSFSTLTFILGVVLLPTGLGREARPIGLVLAPLAVALLIVALAVGIAPAGEPLTFRGGWFILHVLLALVAYACLALAFAPGLLYLIQFRELKSKHFGRWFRFLPSLETLDGLGRRALGIGFPTLTLAMLLGWAWTVRFDYPMPATDPKVVWVLLTWTAFAAAILARWRGAGRGRHGAYASVLGFALVVVSYLLLRLTATSGRVFF
ncbi:MAG: cytochrome C assembly family protein [Longimicrobiales bacterium]